MDLNFLEDFGGIPLFVAPEAKRILDASIWNDSLFLSKHNIIDCSLLIIISVSFVRFDVPCTPLGPRQRPFRGYCIPFDASNCVACIHHNDSRVATGNVQQARFAVM